MKKVASEQDGSRPVTVAPPPLGFDLGHGGLVVSDVVGYNYADPQIEAYHKANPKLPVMGTENVSAVATRGIYTWMQRRVLSVHTTPTRPLAALRQKAGGAL